MLKKSHLSKRRSDGSRRTAVAVVELAVCLPVLVVLLVATIEGCVMLQLQQNLAVTAYEARELESCREWMQVLWNFSASCCSMTETLTPTP